MNTVAAQHYDTDINKEYVIRGNAAILKCVLPSYLSDYLDIVSWKIDDEEMNYNEQNYGIKSDSSPPSILILSRIFYIIWAIFGCNILPSIPLNQLRINTTKRRFCPSTSSRETQRSLNATYHHLSPILPELKHG